MTIKVQQHDIWGAQITIPPELWKAFQELVQRGANLWPDAPPEIKAFADEVTVGKVQQDYVDMRNRARHSHMHICSCGYCTILETISMNPPSYPVSCANPEVAMDGSKRIPCRKVEMFNPPQGKKEG